MTFSFSITAEGFNKLDMVHTILINTMRGKLGSKTPLLLQPVKKQNRTTKSPPHPLCYSLDIMYQAYWREFDSCKSTSDH